MCVRITEEISNCTNNWLRFKSKAPEKGHTHTQMAHDPNSFMKGFASPKLGWMHEMFTMVQLVKEMSWDVNRQPHFVKTGATKFAGRTYKNMRASNGQYHDFDSLVEPPLLPFFCRCRAARQSTLFGSDHSDHSGPRRLIFIRQLLQQLCGKPNAGCESIRIHSTCREISWDARHGECGCQVCCELENEPLK